MCVRERKPHTEIVFSPQTSLYLGGLDSPLLDHTSVLTKP
jgi:hypothetical protein